MISEEQFVRYRDQYAARESSLQKAVLRQKELIRKIYEKGIAAEEILQQFREEPQVNELNHRLLVSLIDRILIYEDNSVDIIYRYTDEMEKCASILKNSIQKYSIQKSPIQKSSTLKVAVHEIIPEKMQEDTAKITDRQNTPA